MRCRQAWLQSISHISRRAQNTVKYQHVIDSLRVSTMHNSSPVSSPQYDCGMIICCGQPAVTAYDNTTIHYITVHHPLYFTVQFELISNKF